MPLLIPLFVYLVSLLLPGMLMAQEIPEALEHEKKMYVDPQGKIYLPFRMPLYLSIATSPGGEARPLLNQKSLENKKKKKQSPFIIHGGEGKHRLMHPENPAQKHKPLLIPADDLFMLHVDKTPPKSWVQASKAPTHRKKNLFVYGQPIQLSLHAKEYSKIRSGLAGIYSPDGTTPFSPYVKPFQFGLEGYYKLYYYAVDQVGNFGKPKLFTFAVDLSSPVTSPQIAGPGHEQILGPKSKLQLIGDDPIAGVASIYYRLKGPSKLKGRYRGPIPMKKMKSGSYKINYFAIDRVKNKEFEKEYSFYLDRKPPKMDIAVLGKFHRYKNKLFLRPDSKILLTGKDQKAGFKQAKYSFAKEFQSFITPIPLPKGQRWVFRYYGLDRVDNASRVKKIIVIKDDTSPYTGNLLFGPIHRSGSHIYAGNDVTIKLESDDSGSGIKETKYRVDGGEWQTYKRGFSINSLGEHVVEYFSRDRVENQERSKKLRFNVDTQGPEIVHQMGGLSRGMEDGLPVYASGSIFFILGNDPDSGLDQVRYQINGRRIKSYKNPLHLTRPGHYRINIFARDQVGNESETKTQFIIQ